MSDAQVVIVGAGISGLAAAVTLQEKGISFLVVESLDRIGGRIHTTSLGDYGLLELGANWIHGTVGNPLYQIAKDQKLLHQPHRTYVGGRMFRTELGHSGNVRNAPCSLFHKYIDEAKEFWHQPTAPAKSVGEFVEEKWKKAPASQDPVQNSAFLNRCGVECEISGCNSLFDLDLHSFGEYEDLPGSDVTIGKGYSSIVNYLASQLPPECLLLSSTVSKINWIPFPADAPLVSLQCENGVCITARHIICTVSLGVLKKWCSPELADDPDRSVFIPRLPAWKEAAVARMGYGFVEKLFLEFSDVFWKSGRMELLWGVDSPLREDLWTQGIIRFEHIGGRVLICWLHGRACEAQAAESDAQVAERCVQILRQAFSAPEDVELTAFCRTTWCVDPRFLGSYSYVAVGSSGDDIDLLAADIGPDTERTLFFAGEATHRSFYSTAHGAYLAGQREAQKVITLVS